MYFSNIFYEIHAWNWRSSPEIYYQGKSYNSEIGITKYTESCLLLRERADNKINRNFLSVRTSLSFHKTRCLQNRNFQNLKVDFPSETYIAFHDIVKLSFGMKTHVGNSSDVMVAQCPKLLSRDKLDPSLEWNRSSMFLLWFSRRKMVVGMNAWQRYRNIMKRD